MNLKTYLTLRIALIAALCLVVAAGYVLVSGAREVQSNSNRIIDIVSRQMHAQLIKTAAGFDRPDRFPYLDPLLESGLLAGFCVKYVGAQGEVTQSSCRGWERSAAVPDWFAAIYRAAFDPGREITRDIQWRGRAYGRISAVANADRQIADAWHDVGALLGLSAITVLALGVLVYVTMTRALRPAREILLGIERLERGDLSVRLPQFELSELQKISAGFNRLAAKLEETIRDRAELTRKLINIQEDERRFLARELHDELGQCLAALSATASSVMQTAEQKCPELVPDGERLAGISTHMMEMLRSMLRRLRPVGIEELGLIGSIRGLIAQWRGGRTEIELEVNGAFEDLSEAVAISVYRIVQECLTNVSKHASARNVKITLARSALDAEPGTRAQDRIDVIVEDDGLAHADSVVLTPKLGVLGMRERVAALGGELMLQARQSKGFVVRALLPISPAA